MNASIVSRVDGMVKELSLLLTQISSEMEKVEDSNHMISASRSYVMSATVALIAAQRLLKKNEELLGKKPTEIQSDGSFKPVIWTL
jgi:hypothetical protein